MDPRVVSIVDSPVVERDGEEIVLSNASLPFDLLIGDVLKCNSNERAIVRVAVDGYLEVNNNEELLIDSGSYYYYARR